MFQRFENIEEFERIYNDPRSYMIDKCECGGAREMVISSATISIDTKVIEIRECAILVCQHCGDEKLGTELPIVIYRAYHKMNKQENNVCKLTSLNNQKYEYAKSAGFSYDCRDMSIPGLNSNMDPTVKEGYLCPVFFERKVLNIFYFDDKYKLNFFSETYGDIRKKAQDGSGWEWIIAFGINKNDHVIMFLSDLDMIDGNDKTFLLLKAYNIPSDHTLIETEFYQAQLNCKFSKPIIERRILRLRNAFYNRIESKYGYRLCHLEAEVECKGFEIQKPVNYSEDEIRRNFVALDGLLNEAIDCEELRKLYLLLISPPPAGYKKLRTRKLLQGIIASQLGAEDAASKIAPLFYLNDCRVCFSHLLPQCDIDEIQKRIVSAFGISSFQDYRRLYDDLLYRLLDLYQYLNIADFS